MSRRRKLVVFDMDSTLIDQEVIDLLAQHANVELEVSEITRQAMAGKIDFEESLRSRVKLLRGLPISAIDAVRNEITLTNGAVELIDYILANGHVPAVVSGGFTSVIKSILEDLGIKYFMANELATKDGYITGEISSAVVDRKAKAVFLKEYSDKEGINIEDSIAIGDGANDIDMVQSAGIGIAFCAKDPLKEVADEIIDIRDLREVIKFI